MRPKICFPFFLETNTEGKAALMFSVKIFTENLNVDQNSILKERTTNTNSFLESVFNQSNIGKLLSYNDLLQLAVYKPCWMTPSLRFRETQI